MIRQVIVVKSPCKFLEKILFVHSIILMMRFVLLCMFTLCLVMKSSFFNDPSLFDFHKLFSDSDIFAPSTKFVFYHLRTSQASTCFVHVQGTTAGPGLLYVYRVVCICFCPVSAYGNEETKSAWILSTHEASEVYVHSPLLLLYTYICTHVQYIHKYVLWPRK